MDIAVLIEDGELVMHDPQCLAVIIARARDEPIMTMFGCEPSRVLDRFKKHKCLEKP